LCEVRSLSSEMPSEVNSIKERQPLRRRAVPIGEAMMAIFLADNHLHHRGQTKRARPAAVSPLA
jgi:hypothetical protein